MLKIHIGNRFGKKIGLDRVSPLTNDIDVIRGECHGALGSWTGGDEVNR